MLARTRSVLHKYVDEDGEELGGGVTYLGQRMTLTLDTTTGEDLPETITVTIEPGDRLND